MLCYAIDSYPLFHIMLYKSSMKFIIQHKFMLAKHTVIVHRPFSTTVPQITKDVILHVSTVRETDSPPL